MKDLLRHDKQRFWSSVNFSETCWNWRGPFHQDGYACFNSSITKKHHRASRVVLEYVGRKLTKEQFACHHCDNPKCVRPSHLFPGTALDNFNDMRGKGRYVKVYLKGERNGRAKITDAEVVEIRRLAVHMTRTAIAKQYGLAISTVCRIVNEQYWAHVPTPVLEAA